MIEFSICGRDVENAELFLNAFGKTAERSVSRVLSRVVKGVRVDTVKTVREEYNIKATQLRQHLNIKKTGNLLDSAAVLSGSKIPLIYFGARPNSPRGKKPATGATVQVKKSRKNIKNSFAAVMRNGHMGLFRRIGVKRLPIEELYGPSVPHMANNKKVLAVINENAVSRFTKNFNHEVSYAFQKIGVR